MVTLKADLRNYGMSKLLSIEFWIATQLFVDLVLVMLLWRCVRKMKKLELEQRSFIKNDELKFLTESIHQEVLERIDKLTHEMGEKAAVEMVDRAAQDIIDLLDPLVKGSESAANAFDHQIKEKQRLIKGLNDALDARIISINLLLSRSEVILNANDKSIYQGNTGRGDSTSARRTDSERRGSSFSSLGQEPSGLRDNASELRANPFYNQDHSSGNRSFADIDGGHNPLQGDIDTKTQENMFDQQQRIVEWYQRGLDVDTIASKLSMPRGEVQLVISLKEKFVKMEKKR
ncbi:MAG: hypothetical protein HQK61_04405 [Desulfamplus sp.]|nr:hypothetical protein [Desulfamplus sp.]